MKLLIKKRIRNFKYCLIERGVTLGIQNILLMFKEKRLKEKCSYRLEGKRQGLVQKFVATFLLTKLKHVIFTCAKQSC